MNLPRPPILLPASFTKTSRHRTEFSERFAPPTDRIVLAMPQQRDPSAPAISSPPRIFCKTCGYALVGLESRACPECGRAFDPANGQTFAKEPPRRWVLRWGRRLAAVILLISLA